MIFFIRYRDEEHTVRVESRNGELVVKYQDEPEAKIDLSYFGNDCTYVEHDQVFFANIVGNKSQYTVWRPQGNVELHVESEYRRIVGLLRGQEIGSENNVYAKMPGKIVKVLVKAGDTVEKGAPVVVMEAMKMENEIRAGISGRVAALSVKEGQAVETGALLLELVQDA